MLLCGSPTSRGINRTASLSFLPAWYCTVCQCPARILPGVILLCSLLRLGRNTMMLEFSPHTSEPLRLETGPVDVCAGLPMIQVIGTGLPSLFHCQEDRNPKILLFPFVFCNVRPGPVQSRHQRSQSEIWNFNDFRVRSSTMSSSCWPPRSMTKTNDKLPTSFD